MELGVSYQRWAAQSLVALPTGGAETQPVFLHPYIWEASSSTRSNKSWCPFNQGQGGKKLKLAVGWAPKV